MQIEEFLRSAANDAPFSRSWMRLERRSRCSHVAVGAAHGSSAADPISRRSAKPSARRFGRAETIFIMTPKIKLRRRATPKSRASASGFSSRPISTPYEDPPTTLATNLIPYSVRDFEHSQTEFPMWEAPAQCFLGREQRSLSPGRRPWGRRSL